MPEKRVVALVAPLVLYDIGLQTARLVEYYPAIVVHTDKMGRMDWLALLASPLLYHVGLAMLCAGAIIAWGGRRGWQVPLLAAQALALFTVLDETAAFVYFEHTNTPLQFEQVRYWLASPEDLAVVAEIITPVQWLFLCTPVLLIALGPWLFPRLFRESGEPQTEWWRATAVALAGLPVAAIGLLPVASHAADASMVRAPVLELIASSRDVDEAPAAAAHLVLEATRPSRALTVNVVLVILESTRAKSVAPYAEVATTPFFAELAKKSLLVGRAYTIVPHTSKVLISLLCGMEPAHIMEPLALKMGMLQRCLPSLLGEAGYRSVFFQSADPRFEGRVPVVKAMGFNQFMGLDQFQLKGFKKANFLGYEDEVMLGPSRRWIEGHRDKPFFAVYLTIAPHHECEPLTRHGFLDLDDDPAVNRYLNNVRSEDFFLRGLIEQYRELGIDRQTIFIVLGDHGEAFGEHGRRAHDSVPYEEGIRVPFLIHDASGKWVRPGTLPGPVSHLDVVPTILDVLGMRVTKGKLPGFSIFSRPKDAPVLASCFGDRDCLVHLRADRKLIHFYGHRPDELYFLDRDPGETHNLAAEKPELVARKLDELLHWDQRVRALYWGEGLTLRDRKR